MSVDTSRPRMAGKSTEARRASFVAVNAQRDWEHRRSVWSLHLNRQPWAGSLTDCDGTRWELVAPDMPRVWLGDNGMYMLQGDLAGMLASQDVRARRPALVALGSAIVHAARAARWGVRGALRTPSVRLVGACLLTAALVGLLVAVR